MFGRYAEFSDRARGAATSTLTITVLPHDELLASGPAWVDIAWLGDTSAWVLAPDGRFERLTKPHHKPDDQHFLLRHVASEEGADTVKLNLEEAPVWRLLLCSDGLDGYVEPEDIGAALADAATVEEARDALITLALDAGGKDNVTLIVAEIGPGEPGRGYVDACPGCGRKDPGVITRGDASSTTVTSCCEAEVDISLR
ncbi:PP2C family protein-serine/threonine phosphatase [Nonomuraea sp. NPDC059023]|uniref:PP2C family protein-serine/threonine phosphatase n=1 Tax=unclassified Nonomuraea TaxID=2593643 RepID=UPI00367E924A